MHITDKDIPHEMVKIVKKKPDFHVKEKILVLIDTWQEAFGGPQGRYPQFFLAYHDLLRAGVVFPKRPVKSTPIFTPTQTKRNQYKKTEKVEISSDSEIHVLSLVDIQNARGIMNVLFEMLHALEQGNKEGVKQEVIVELVEQCRLYRQRVVHLVNSTSLNAGERRSNQAPLQQLLLPVPSKSNDMPTTSPRSDPHLDLLSGEEFGTTSIENSLALIPAYETIVPSTNEQNMLVISGMYPPGNNGNNSTANMTFPVEQSYDVASQFQHQQQYLPYRDVMNHEQSIYEQSLFVQRVDQSSHGDPSYIADTQQQAHIGSVDQGGALPPPPWEIELTESSESLTLQQQHLQNEQAGEIITYSPRNHGNQSMGMYHPQDEASYLSNTYSQSMQGGQMSSYSYGYNASYSYSNTNELSNRLYGLSLQDRYMNADHSYQMPITPPLLQEPAKQLKADDNLFGDLVSMAKSKTNKHVN